MLCAVLVDSRRSHPQRHLLSGTRSALCAVDVLEHALKFGRQARSVVSADALHG